MKQPIFSLEGVPFPDADGLTLGDLLALLEQSSESLTITLCGASRFEWAFHAVARYFTLPPYLYKVLSIGAVKSSDAGTDRQAQCSSEVAVQLDLLHLQKMRGSQVVCFLNLLQHFGISTQREYTFAKLLGLPCLFAEVSQFISEDASHVEYQIVFIGDPVAAGRVRLIVAGAQAPIQDKENPIAVLQDKVSACSAQLEQASHALETAMNSYNKATLSFRDMGKQERLALCRERGLYINGKPVSGHQSVQQLYDAFLSHKKRELRLSALMTQKYHVERALNQATRALKTAISQEELNRRGHPIVSPDEVSMGAHVWAIVDGDVYECIVQEKGQRSDIDRCALRFARPQDVPQGVRIGWRKHSEIRLLEQPTHPGMATSLPGCTRSGDS